MVANGRESLYNFWCTIFFLNYLCLVHPHAVSLLKLKEACLIL